MNHTPDHQQCYACECGQAIQAFEREHHTDRVVAGVQAVLTPDLLRAPWRGGRHPLAGHCYVAAEAVWHLLYPIWGSQVTVWRGRCPGGTHWWLRVAERVVDPTGAQFDPRTRMPKGYGRDS